MRTTLVVFRGLPGVGKSTLARGLAGRIGAAYLRIDSIEQALRGSAALNGEFGDAGYRAAIAAAEDNLRLGNEVIVDGVVAAIEARDALCAAAARAGARVFQVEVVCSDVGGHRARVVTRETDVPGLLLPRWDEVQTRRYDCWDVDLVIDTAASSVETCVDKLQTELCVRSARG